MSDILEFQGEFRWLSNFWPAPVSFENAVFPSVEHAYQAAKFTALIDRATILSMTAGQAKRFARTAKLPTWWEHKKTHIMFQLCWQKFQHKELQNKLIKTAPFLLVEGNTWNDTFWGVCKGKGSNVLGSLLMSIRDILCERSGQST